MKISVRRPLTGMMFVLVLGCGVLIGRNSVERKETSSSESLKNMDARIQVPDLRQYGTYTCGTTCVQMIMNWAYPGKGDINLADLEKELGSTDEGGTTPQNILDFFEKNDVNAEMQEGMSTDELTQALDEGKPVILAIQAWSTAEDGSYNTKNVDEKDTYLIEGHYVICTGYQKTEDGYQFCFNDPANVGLCYMSSEELNERWIDMDASGRVYDHTGIVIEMDSDYSPDTMYHLD